MPTPILQCGFRNISSAKCGGLGMGGRFPQLKHAKTGSRAWWSLQTGQGLCLPWVHKPPNDAVVAGWIQVLSNPQSHAFQGERKGLKIILFLAFLLSAISKSLWKWVSLLGFMSRAFLSALCCSVLHFSGY